MKNLRTLGIILAMTGLAVAFETLGWVATSPVQVSASYAFAGTAIGALLGAVGMWQVALYSNRQWQLEALAIALTDR